MSAPSDEPPTSAAASPYRRPLRDPPPIQGNRRLWLRPALAAVVVLMLPFSWSEDFTCGRQPMPPVSGLDILFGRHGGPQPAAIFFGFLLAAVALGFVAARAARLWQCALAHGLAASAGLGATTMCGMMMAYGRAGQPLVYPAAWIGTLSAAAMTLEALVAFAQALHGAFLAWRMGRIAPFPHPE